MKELRILKREEGQKALKYLVKVLPLAGEGLLRKSMRKKNITLNGKKMEGKEILKAGDILSVWFSDETFEKFSKSDEKISSSPELDIKPWIIYEDEEVLLINKPAGILSQKDGTGAPVLNDGVLSYLKHLCTPSFKPSICNRLDRNTSGLVIVGKTISSLQKLNNILRERTIEKYYVTILFGMLKGKGNLKGYMMKDQKKNTVSFSNEKKEGAAKVETSYEVVKNFTKDGFPLSVAKVHLITGKSHQIRVHFSSLGVPILGDQKYGSEASKKASSHFNVKRQLLHSISLRFPAMAGTLEQVSKKEFKAPLPKDMKNIIEESVSS